MSTTISLPELPARIQKLLEERRHHADALVRIDKVLAGIGAALGVATAKPPAPKAAAAPAAKVPAAKAPAAPGKKQRPRKTFAITGEESILAFVKLHKNPTTGEISKHWKAEGRGGRAINRLGDLVKAKKLKRTPLGKGILGSRYSLV